ncbi:hypothetical protein [Hyphomonas sp.]|jgi:hypothetical protein|uniref:hypothetical protein n=1 Tax=Hyphomonas sp. TaxID=87 RepID=UPI0032EC343A
MIHFIPRKSISQIMALIASAAFVFIGVSAEANAQAQGSAADPAGLVAGQSCGIQTPQGTNVMQVQADGSCYGTAGPARGRRTN